VKNIACVSETERMMAWEGVVSVAVVAVGDSLETVVVDESMKVMKVCLASREMWLLALRHRASWLFWISRSEKVSNPSCIAASILGTFEWH